MKTPSKSSTTPYLNQNPAPSNHTSRSSEKSSQRTLGSTEIPSSQNLCQLLQEVSETLPSVFPTYRISKRWIRLLMIRTTLPFPQFAKFKSLVIPRSSLIRTVFMKITIRVEIRHWTTETTGKALTKRENMQIWLLQQDIQLNSYKV